MKICIVDDEPISLAVLAGLTAALPGVQAEVYSDPLPALASCRHGTFDLLIVDQMMPGMTGIEVIRHVRAMPEHALVPIMMITADDNRTLRLEAISAGATDFLAKPIDPDELRLRVGNLLDLRRAQRSLADRAYHLASEVASATRRITEREEELIWRLARAIEYRDGLTGDHVTRVARVALIIAQRLNQPPAFCHNLFLAAPLHDTGKIAVPDSILNKPGRLTTEEIVVMRRHTLIGGEILSDGTSDLVCMAQDIALAHHERWDGTGYPHGLAREEIPLSARIVAVADVIDALCAERIYKPAWSPDRALAEIIRLSGSHFDPACVAALLASWDRIEPILSSSPAALSPADSPTIPTGAGPVP
jgi:putative two-component system response regulator